MMDPTRPALWRSALLSLSLLALSCGGGTEKPPPKDPPQALLSVPKPNTVGDKLTVQVSATGCDQIHSLSIYNRANEDEFVKAVPYAGGGTVSVDLLPNDFKYTRGIAALLSLRARVVCTDGRQNDSQPQPATFFPVAEVIDPLPGSEGQVVPDYFVTEGSGQFLTFLGCGNAPGGIPKLFRVNKSGGVLAEVNMPFLCTTGTVITPKHPSTGRRWVWTPNGGAIAVNDNLVIAARTDIPLDLLAVGSDGDALIYEAGAGIDGKYVARIHHETGAIVWSYSPRGFLITTPAVRNDDLLIASITADGAPSGRANVLVTRVDYGRQNPATGGLELNVFLMKQVASDASLETAPPATFNPDGTLLYLAFEGLGGITQVLACATQTDGCEGTAQRWTNPPTLGARVVATVPYAGGSRIAAISPQNVWFLEASTGAVLNKNGLSLSPEGALIVLQVQSGGGSYPHSFYLLNGPVPQEGLPAPMPLEIVGTDDPTKGELFRYQVSSGSMSAAVDESGTLWIRVGASLVRPLTPPEYRQALPVPIP